MTISENAVSLERGRHVKGFPQVSDLEDDTSSFLINIKRAIVGICYLESYVLPLSKKYNNLEYLDKSVRWFDEKYANLMEAIDAFIPGAKHLVELINIPRISGR